MRKTKFFLGAALALCLMAFSAPTAQAQTLAPGVGSTFSGTSAGTPSPVQVFTIGTALRAECSVVTNTGTILTATTARVAMNYQNCRVRITGLWFNATVTACNPWIVTVTGWVTPGSVATGTLTLCNSTVITLSGSPCVVTVGSQVVGPAGVIARNTPVGGPYTGVRIEASATGISYTSSGCPGVPTSGTNATYSGHKQETGVWVV